MSNFKHVTHEEVKALEKLCHAHTRNDCLVLLALRTGARKAELLNITPKDLANDGVWIRGLKGSKDRFLPLKRDFVAALRAISCSERLFDISPQRVDQIWALYRGACGNKHFHCLRHSFAVRLYDKTRDVLLVQAALGHRSIQSTMVYTVALDVVAKLRHAAI